MAGEEEDEEEEDEEEEEEDEEEEEEEEEGGEEMVEEEDIEEEEEEDEEGVEVGEEQEVNLTDPRQKAILISRLDLDDRVMYDYFLKRGCTVNADEILRGVSYVPLQRAYEEYISSCKM